MALSALPLHAKEAIDPVAIFIVIVILVNVVSAFAKRARQQAQRTSSAQAPAASPATTTMTTTITTTATSAAAAARVAQRARLQQAIKAAQQRLATPQPTPAPVILAAAAPPSPSMPLPAAPVLMDLATLPTFEYADTTSPALALAQLPLDSTARPIGLALFEGRLSGADLFVAAAIVGPPAALRQTGHTPAGW
jgi:hypothetical protein